MRILDDGESATEKCDCGGMLTVSALANRAWRIQHGDNPEAAREFETPGWITATNPDVVAWLAAVHEHATVPS